MSYIPTNWKAGDTVTSAKLNKIEQGIATSSGTLIVHMIEQEENSGGGVKSGSGQKSMSNSNEESASTLDKTWQEIYDAAQVGNVILMVEHEDENMTYYTFIPLFGLAVTLSEDLFIAYFSNGNNDGFLTAYAYSDDGTLMIGEPPEEDNNENEPTVV